MSRFGHLLTLLLALLSPLWLTGPRAGGPTPERAVEVALRVSSAATWQAGARHEVRAAPASSAPEASALRQTPRRALAPRGLRPRGPSAPYLSSIVLRC